MDPVDLDLRVQWDLLATLALQGLKGWSEIQVRQAHWDQLARPETLAPREDPDLTVDQGQLARWVQLDNLVQLAHLGEQGTEALRVLAVSRDFRGCRANLGHQDQTAQWDQTVSKGHQGILALRAPQAQRGPRETKDN